MEVLVTRSVLVALAILTASSATLMAQPEASPDHGQHGASLFFEAALGARLNRQPNPGVHDARWVATWEIGPSFNRGDWAWGAGVMVAADEDGWRWGVRPRYRRWLSPTTALDFGAGILLDGKTSYGEQHYPGFTGLVGLSYGDWLGVNIELQAIRTSTISYGEYQPAQGIDAPHVTTTATDWGLVVSFRLRGLGAILLSAAEAILVVGAASSM
jgi:hypothetical protein